MAGWVAHSGTEAGTSHDSLVPMPQLIGEGATRGLDIRLSGI